MTSVNADPSTLELVQGNKGQVTGKVVPSDAKDQGVVYTSESTSVATVSSTGEVTAVGVGTTNIVVTSNDGGHVAKSSIKVTPKPVNVESVVIAPKTVSVEEGNTTKLTHTVAPANADNKSVTYDSSDKAVATVTNDGTVTAIKPGNCNITVKSVDGNKTDSCAVTVTAKPIKVESVTISPTTLSLEEGATGNVTGSVVPANADNKKVTYKSSVPATATVDASGKVTAIAEGTSNITATSEDGDKVGTCVLTVTAKEVEPEPEE